MRHKYKLVVFQHFFLLKNTSVEKARKLDGVAPMVTIRPVLTPLIGKINPYPTHYFISV